MTVKYSEYFDTIYDQPKPVGDNGALYPDMDPGIGRGGHYSICEYRGGVLDERKHRFCIVWDEDHDLRVIRFIEDVILEGHNRGPVAITDLAFIGERKGTINIFTTVHPANPAELYRMTDWLDLIGSQQPDPWGASVNEPQMLICDDEDLVLAYLKVVSNLWGISCSTIR
jgi:hypothetical protein